VLRNPRLILLFLLTVAPISPARGDDTLANLAHRFTAPPPESPESPGVPASAGMSPGMSPASVESESQPLGPADASAPALATARNKSAAPAIASGSWVMDTLTALGLVLAAILAARWAYTRYAGRAFVAARTTPVVEVLARTAVAPRNHVLLLRVGSRILVVSDSSGGMRTLANIDDAEEVAGLIGAVAVTRDNSITKNFTRLFQNFNGQYDAQRAGVEGGDDGEHTLDRTRDSLSGLLHRVRLLGDKGGAA